MTLYINCCVREESRTDRLALAVLQKLGGDFTELKLYGENLKPLDSEMLNKRTALIEQGDYSDQMFDYAKQFAGADTIVLAAPYWDLSFPATLKTYIENIYVTGIVSAYNENGMPVGLCKAKELYYITTAGGPYDPTYSYGYIESLAKNFLLEQKENIRILHAVESGSRAWGFASPDSDYDVRFIYVRKPEHYLKLEKARDVIELPINDELDINGWDLDKTLRLLYKSNPTLFEWFSSPITYRRTEFADRISPLLTEYFTPSNSIYHYLGTAKSNYIAYIRSKDEVKAKKYFYVLRPLLACLWIMERQCPPPMLFDELRAAYLDKSIESDVDYLLNIKIKSPEIKTIPAIDTITDYILRSMKEIQEYLQSLPKREKKSWDKLNNFFLSELYQ